MVVVADKADGLPVLRQSPDRSDLLTRRRRGGAPCLRRPFWKPLPADQARSTGALGSVFEPVGFRRRRTVSGIAPPRPGCCRLSGHFVE
jgi:hypothetical protein